MFERWLTKRLEIGEIGLGEALAVGDTGAHAGKLLVQVLRSLQDAPRPRRRVVFRVVGERLLAAAEQGWRAHLPHRGGDRQGHEQLCADELLRGEDVDAVYRADREPSTGAALRTLS